MNVTGNGAAAGIGLGRAWDDNLTGGSIIIEDGNITAQGGESGNVYGAGIGTGAAGNSKTASLDGIIIKGGTVRGSLGKGYVYYGSTITVSTITIYDDVDIVDASSITESVTYMHGEDNVTANAGDYFTVSTDGDRTIITKNDGTNYTVSIADGITGGTIAADKAQAKYGEIITLTITPDSGYGLQTLTVKDSGNNDITAENYRFVMPKSNVTVSAAFTETTASFNESTGVLTLCGNVVSDDVKAWRCVVNEYGGIAEDSRVTSVVCEPGAVLPADCSELFRDFNSVITIDLRNADTSNVIDTSHMFAGDGNLTTIYVSNSWSMENVTSSDAMFAWCMPLWGGNGTSYQEVQNSYYESNGNDLDAATLAAGSGEYAIIDGKDGKPGYLTCTKATPAAPTPNALTYTGEPQALVKAGDGTMTYSLDDTNYSAEIPTGTDAGTYTVYYMVEESDNWEEADGSVEVIINPIVVTFNTNGRGITPDSQSFTALNGQVSQPDELTAEGYTFGGWFTDSDCTEAYDFDSEVSGNLTLYAKWTAIIYTITYSGIDGAAFETANPESYTVESESFTLTNPTRDGYTFTGWTGTDLDEATLTATIPAGSTGNREYTATWTKNGFTPQDPDTPEFAYHSLILSGQIGVIFHVYAPEGASSKDYCMYFDVSGDKSQNTQPVNPFETLNEDGYQFFGFKCYINSVQMADDIHATLSYGDNESITETYTAKRYLDSLIADTAQSADVTALGKAIKDYGCYVQPVLADENGWTIGKKHAAMDSAHEYTDSDFTDAETATNDYAITCTVPEGSGIKDVSFALVLDSETAIELYLASKDTYTGNVAAYVDGGSKNMAVRKGSEYVVSIGNISAHKLGTTHTVSITTQYDNMQEVSFEVKLSALSYVQSAIHSSEAAMKRAVTSLWRYWDATMTYRKNRPEIYGGGE